MKVLFAVNNENISTQIVKEYQKQYKEIISYKNMYYFNAIVKELQRDKSYDRIVISEDLEPFANNNYDAIDKFLFEKLDNISDEASGLNGEDIPIILISTDRRIKSEPILVKLFGIGIYNALLGQDRSTAKVCALLNKPRSKKEAKIYYKIESDEVSYRNESEENVSEAEIKNILNHYKRLGKDESRYVESFNNIAAQYNDAQLRIITKFLPLNVKAVLEEKSPKYQSVMTFGDTASTLNTMKKQKQDDGLKIGFLKNSETPKLSKPVIVPTAVKKVAIKKTIKNSTSAEKEVENKIEQDNDEMLFQPVESTQSILQEDVIDIQPTETQKKGRGRPKKTPTYTEETKKEEVKRGRGRPKKILKEDEEVLPELEEDEVILPGFENIENSLSTTDNNNFEDEIESILPGFENEEETTILPGFEKEEETTSLPGFEDIDNQENEELPGFDIPETIDNSETQTFFEPDSKMDESNSNYVTNFQTKTNYSQNNNLSGLLSKDKKIVSFVGTTKNGTSFLVNNVAKCLSSMGIKTAILDLTTNRNSFYIYTKNEEQLRNIASDSIKKLRSGIKSGITVDKNLDVYTALPGDKVVLEDTDSIISTLVQNYSAILIDTDFNTPADYFGVSQEIYIVQTMDILTIQPMTAFLRDLKAKEILRPEKIRVIINKEMHVRGLTAKTIIGGLAFYNDPAMSFMTELFDKENVIYYTIPFEEEVCSKYLEGVMDCEISINGYPKNFNIKLKELANMVYPLINSNYKAIGNYESDYKFNANMNHTLEQMRKKY